MVDWKGILDDNERSLSDDELLKYINDETIEREKQQIEGIATDHFESDALEGIKMLQNPEHANQQVADLKKQLHRYLRSNRKRKKNLPEVDAHFILYGVIIVLLTCIIVYAVVKMLKQ